MKSIHSSRIKEFVNLIREVEHELADWKYYKAVNGKSALAALFFIFLKYVSDISKNSLNGGADVILEMKNYLARQHSIPENYVYHYLLKRINQWKDDGDILLQYVQRIHFEEIPYDFIDVLNKIGDLELSNGDICNDLMKAVSALYTSLYSEVRLNNKLPSGELFTFIVSGNMLDCQNGMSIYDFACGTGGMLTFGGADECVVYGQDKDFEKAAVAYMLLKLRKIKEVHMKVGDVMEEPAAMGGCELKFDRIISVPPAGKRNYPLQQSEFWIYAHHIIKKLKNGGKAILAAPIAILSKEGLTKDRKWILADGYLRGIVQLPAIMSPDIGKICLIMLAKEGGNKENSEIYMADFSGIKGKQSISTDENELHLNYERMYQMVNNREILEGVSNYISVEEILNYNLNLTPALYFRDIIEIINRDYKISDVLKMQKKLMEQYHKSEEKLNQAVLNYCNFLEKKGKHRHNPN